MARKGRPKTSTRDDVTVRLDRTIADKARRIAYARGIPIAEYLTGLLRKPVERDHERLGRKSESS
jgi:hypothetical protein